MKQEDNSFIESSVKKAGELKEICSGLRNTWQWMLTLALSVASLSFGLRAVSTWLFGVGLCLSAFFLVFSVFTMIRWHAFKHQMKGMEVAIKIGS